MTLKPRSQSSSRKMLCLLLLPVIILIMVCSYRAREQQLQLGRSFDSRDQEISDSLFSFKRSSSGETNGLKGTCLVYPYSVIKGGVRDAGELKNAIQNDPVVAKHYADFNLAKAKVVSLPSERFAYVAYRIKNQVYWTKRKLKLAKGETVLTDGKNYVRGRCGNRFSEVSQANTSPHEPNPIVFDTPIRPETAVPLRMAYSPQAGSLQLVSGLNLKNGESSLSFMAAALGRQSSGRFGFYRNNPAGSVRYIIPGSGVGGGCGTPGSGTAETGQDSEPSGSASLGDRGMNLSLYLRGEPCLTPGSHCSATI
jgi:hypothetical protein